MGVVAEMVISFYTKKSMYITVQEYEATYYTNSINFHIIKCSY